ncbi:MAG: hypothetical protein PF961_03320 [Planctomycetota bacterium]|jgi:hypothetical protein|nr:hypothetical protein [Planctomycetota bacterium]
MNMLTDDEWNRLLPKLREQCPRLTEQDFVDADQRIDTLSAKIQNRHWINRIEARRIVLALLQDIRSPAGA